MNNAAYQSFPAVSSHWLIDLLVSPAHCYRRHMAPARSWWTRVQAPLAFAVWSAACFGSGVLAR